MLVQKLYLYPDKDGDGNWYSETLKKLKYVSWFLFLNNSFLNYNDYINWGEYSKRETSKGLNGESCVYKKDLKLIKLLL